MFANVVLCAGMPACYPLLITPMTGHRDLLAVIRAYMANDDADGLADDLLITLQLDDDQLDQLSDLRDGL